MTIWWASGFHCLTCGVFSARGCKEHRAGNIPAKAIIEATLDDIKILSDGMAEMIVAELKGSREEAEQNSAISGSEEGAPASQLPKGGDGRAGVEGESSVDVPEHFLVSDTGGQFRCSCGMSFESEHVFLSHVELEEQMV